MWTSGTVAGTTPVSEAGSGPLTGVYLLRINVTTPIQVVFGRFAASAPITVPAGDLLYVGSACARCGTPALAHRVLRHLTRTPPRPVHRLYLVLAAHFAAAGANIAPPPKHLRWHVDYLLDTSEAEVAAVALWRTDQPLEHDMAAFLLASRLCAPLAPGLGASDHRGGTHLLVLHGGDAAWTTLLAQLSSRMRDSLSPDQCEASRA